MAEWGEVELYGGPLDGQTALVRLDDPGPGTALIADGCAYLGGWSWYEPDASSRWVWVGDTP
jgi:hypothetical protein